MRCNGDASVDTVLIQIFHFVEFVRIIRVRVKTQLGIHLDAGKSVLIIQSQILLQKEIPVGVCQRLFIMIQIAV